MIHSTVKIFQIIAIVGCASSSIYYFLCLWAATVFLRAREVDKSVCRPQNLPPISILKPLKGTDPDIYESFRSHCLQDYPEYEIIFGVSDPRDPAVASVEHPVGGCRKETWYQRKSQQPGTDGPGGAA
jgi:ceramide glucosyltransferase